MLSCYASCELLTSYLFLKLHSYMSKRFGRALEIDRLMLSLDEVVYDSNYRNALES